jgi:hypothetical protein
MRTRLRYLVVLVVAFGLIGVVQAGTVAERLETFDADPGWAASGNKSAGNDYGYLAGPSNTAGGQSAGEAGGTFRRTGMFTYYADTDLKGAFDTSGPLTMSGQIAVTAPIPDPGSDRNILGYLDKDSVTPTMLGIRICDPKNSRADWRIRLYSINTAGDKQGSPAGDGVEMSVDGNYTFEWSYDPDAGANGQLAVTVFTDNGSIWVGSADDEPSQEETITMDLGTGHGMADTTARFNAFGMGVFQQSANTFTASIYLDDLLYNIIEPGKASNPNPPDGGLVETMFVALTWKADELALLHDVYIGDNFEDVNAGTGDTYRGRQFMALMPVGGQGFAYPDGLVPGTTYYWRVDEINDSHPDSPWKGDVWSFMVPPYTAYMPEPGDGAATARPDTTLAWSAGLNVMEHRVYFGQDLELVSRGAAEVDKGIQEETAFDPNALLAGTTYYWRVDEIDILGDVHAGEVWSFTTVIPVDDFESYTDNIGAREAVYQSWIDGWGYTAPETVAGNGTGSTVGYAAAANGTFNETDVVHSGGQSMPFDYNNVDSPFYSEVGRTFTPPENWTADGANTLVLYVHGRRSSGAASLYVAVEDSTGRRGTAVHPDDAVVKTRDWVQWQVPSATFADAGVNMAAIRKLAIGVGDPDNPDPGPTGLLYIDDIARAISPAAE